MAKQLTCLLVMVLALVFVWADDGIVTVNNGSTPTIVTPTINNPALNLTDGTIPNPKTIQDDTPPPPTLTPTPGKNCDSLEDMFNCTTCVLNNCTFVQESYGAKCTNDSDAFDQFTLWISHSVAECPNITTTTTSTTPSTTPAPTNATTTSTTPTTTTTTKPTNATTTTAPITTTTPTPTSTIKPSGSTTPAPSKDASWGWGPFFAGIAFAAGLSSVGYVLWRFYKVRTERNYHTL